MSTIGPFGALPGSTTYGDKKHNRQDGHGNVVGLFVPERDTTRITRNMMQFNGNWKMIPNDSIVGALHFYDTDKFVQDAVQMKLNHILGGGITFTRRFHKMTPHAARWHSSTYTALLRQIYRYGLACGFAARSIKPHPEHVGEPILLDLTRVDIYVLTDAWGRSHFKFFEQQSNVASAMDAGYEIENVVIIPFNMPTSNAQIKSIADVLEVDFKTEMTLRQCMIIACKLKCYPPIITQKMTQNSDKIGMYSSFGINNQANGGINSQDGGDRDSAMYMQRVDNERINGIQAAMRELNSSQSVDDIQSNGIHAMMYSNQVYLDNDRTVARTDAPNEPISYIEFSQKRRDDVFAYFSIPPGVVTAGGSAGDRSSSSSMNSMTIFINDQKQLKNRFLSIVQNINDDINNNMNMLDVIMDNANKRQKMNDSQVRSMIETDVDMPGIPEDDVVHKLYWMGALKYDMFCEIMAAKHGLAKSRSFNPTPTIDIKLLNGIQPEPPKPK